MLRERWCPRKKERKKEKAARGELTCIPAHRLWEVLGSLWPRYTVPLLLPEGTRLAEGQGHAPRCRRKGSATLRKPEGSPETLFSKAPSQISKMEFWWKFDGHSHRACAWLQAAELIQVLTTIGGSGTPFLDEAFRSFLKCGERVRLRER